LNFSLSVEQGRIIEKSLEKGPELRREPASELRTDLKRLRRDTVSQASVDEAFALAVHAPSNSNIQPCHLVVVSGLPR